MNNTLRVSGSYSLGRAVLLPNLKGDIGRWLRRATTIRLGKRETFEVESEFGEADFTSTLPVPGPIDLRVTIDQTGNRISAKISIMLDNGPVVWDWSTDAPVNLKAIPFKFRVGKAEVEGKIELLT